MVNYGDLFLFRTSVGKVWEVLKLHIINLLKYFHYLFHYFCVFMLKALHVNVNIKMLKSSNIKMYKYFVVNV